MADIVIRGYKMPCNCGGCEFFFENSLGAKWCEIKFTPTEEAGRPSWCPLIALPEGHGRLVDGSFLEQRCKRQMVSEWNAQAKPQSWSSAYEQFLEDVENCATIVPAEEEDI